MKEPKDTKKFIKGKSGITLLALVITIIVLLILAGISISMLTGDNATINRAGKTKIYADLAKIKEALEVNMNYTNYKSDDIYYMTAEDANKYIPKEYENKFGVYQGDVYYLDGVDENDELLQHLETMGIKTLKYGDTVTGMTPDEFKYYIELGILKDEIENHKRIGRDLDTTNTGSDNTAIMNRINTNLNDTASSMYKFTYGWYLIGSFDTENHAYDKDYNDLGLNYVGHEHGPYLVNYGEYGDNISVLSIERYGNGAVCR